MKKHVLIGSIICLATVVIFLVFWGKLPADVPIHFDSDGNVNSTLPKAAVVFGIPAVCTLLNVFSGMSLAAKQEKRVLFYYLLPVISIIVSAVVLALAL